MTCLFFHQVKKVYFLVVDEGSGGVPCSRCKRLITIGSSFVFHKQVFLGKKMDVNWCRDCFGYAKSGEYSEYSVVYVTTVVPENCIVVPNMPPLLKRCTTDLFRAAWINEGIAAEASDVKVIDRTRLAGRPEGSWQGVTVGSPDFTLLEEKDAPLLNDKVVVALLEDLKDATPVLPEFERKMIEGKKR